ncbi:AbrB/MazE/SpoVT family DNA-binding domain-containing protein [Vagococcus hydrophili]|uniref:AbrB/MazE/SpoVT family DNA-binding domain-containing protein n=1 Tax=Vagococcus hydrophili TaxID=2714947 RepID=A0A6G8AU50_9ENTE|nr:AbrB/MazE/SpoVT family DNA-binding domain-containing protein [Vagococcus hydrophili]QIL48499.1 AbrB/MazE/SpoVT family DNA-binding domain-containing protein [Vagococcus hydrophili]
MELVKLSRWGNSNAVRIPKNILNKLEINTDSSEVEFELELNSNNQIVLTQKEEDKNYLATLFKNYEVSESDKVELDWGEPKGVELF